jgi:DNA polymerase III gamma/tau subunit
VRRRVKIGNLCSLNASWTPLQSRDEDLLFNLDKKEVISEVAPSFTPRELQRRIALVEEAKEALRRNANPRLVLENLFLQFLSEEAIRLS